MLSIWINLNRLRLYYPLQFGWMIYESLDDRTTTYQMFDEVSHGVFQQSSSKYICICMYIYLWIPYKFNKIDT